jgi:peptidoglycan-associated lipoprotein
LPFLFVVGSALAFIACTPDYPKCKTDEHCKNRPTPKTDKLLWCVKGQCVECRDKADCPEGQDCDAANKCVDIPGYCSPTKPCPPGQVCRNNRCGPECSPEFPCPAGQKCQDNRCVPDVECSDTIPCPPGKKCVNNKCVAAPKCPPTCPPGTECKEGSTECTPIEGYCDDKKPCPPGQVCKNNRCEAKPVVECTPPTIYFDFDKSNIREDQRKAVDDMAACLKQMADAKWSLEGHCDERGTKEYNIALGERRYKTVLDALKAAGVPEANLSGISYGEEKPVCTEHNEGCWQKNRRVEAKKK